MYAEILRDFHNTAGIFLGTFTAIAYSSMITPHVPGNWFPRTLLLPIYCSKNIVFTIRFYIMVAKTANLISEYITQTQTHRHTHPFNFLFSTYLLFEKWSVWDKCHTTKGHQEHGWKLASLEQTGIYITAHWLWISLMQCIGSLGKCCYKCCLASHCKGDVNVMSLIYPGAFEGCSLVGRFSPSQV